MSTWELMATGYGRSQGGMSRYNVLGGWGRGEQAVIRYCVHNNLRRYPHLFDHTLAGKVPRMRLDIGNAQGPERNKISLLRQRSESARLDPIMKGVSVSTGRKREVRISRPPTCTRPSKAAKRKLNSVLPYFLTRPRV